MADCPICSKGTVLEGGRRPVRRSTGGSGRRAKAPAAQGAGFAGPHVSAGPYSDGGGSYVVRLERVAGGVRLAEWDGSGLRRRAPVLDGDDLPALIAEAGSVLDARSAARLSEAMSQSAPAGTDRAAPEVAFGVSRGRSGDFKEELRVEALAEGRVRIARWVLRPAAGWELQDAPPMLPAARYAEALADARRHGILAGMSDAGDPARL